jgi:uncharacterized membrane protein
MKHVHLESSGWSDRATAYVTSGVDAIVVVAYLVVVDLATVGGVFPPAARAAVALPLVVFLPGYALVTALFPRTTASFLDDEPRDPFAGAVDGALSPTERVAVSFGTSLAVVPLVGLVHSVAGLGFGTSALLGTVNTVVAVGLAVGVVRRVRTPRGERVSFSPRSWSTALGTVFRRRSRAEVVLTAAVLAAVLVATGSLGFALLGPADGESYTTVTLLTENESGEFVMDGYPETLANESSLVVGVTNHEGQRTAYTVVTELQAVDAANDSTAVRADRELGRQNRTVAAGDTWYAEQSVTPGPSIDVAETRLRLRFLVYRGAAPADPAVENAYEYVDLSLSNAST